MFVAAVARIMRPGCKYDTVPILEGSQGKGKSSAIEALFTPWFSDDLAELGSKDAAMQVRCAWAIEIAELASMGRPEIERVKAFITRSVDRFRPSYGRRVETVPRQSVLIGTTNTDQYLKDETGGRRFWPIRCNGKIDVEAIKRDKDQLWAEAVALFEAGTQWWFTDRNVVSQAREVQAERYVGDPWESPIASFLSAQDSVNFDEVFQSLGLDKSKWGQAEQNRVARCLKTLGWEKYRTTEPPRKWRYRPCPSRD
jgi:predicted P-loop ATPase